jgi:acetolactate synthase-1/2/3 large subunit
MDSSELEKVTLHPTLKVKMDAGSFLRRLAIRDDIAPADFTNWLKLARAWRNKYPALNPKWLEDVDYVNSFYLIDEISRQMQAGDVYVGGRAGTCVDAAIQAFKVKAGQRVFVTKGLSSMGYGLPAAIGGAYATGRKIVCVNGDGGFVMNIQELEVIRRDKLDIKLFILDNQGYSTIRATQKNVFAGHFAGCGPTSGLTLGNIEAVAKAYGIRTFVINSQKNMKEIVSRVLSFTGPVLVNVRVNPDQPIEPRQASMKLPDGRMVSRPLEDMRPFLPPEEIADIMSVSSTR